MLRRFDGQTFLGSKRVARQKLPKHTETTVHRVKVSLLDWRIRWRVILPGLGAEGVELLGESAVPVRFGVPAASVGVGVGSQGPGAGAPGGEDGQVAGPTRKPGQGLQRDAGV